MSKVQSVLFDKKLWDIPKATSWILMHGFRVKKIDITEHKLRFRQLDPNFSYYRTKKIGKGIELIIGFK